MQIETQEVRSSFHVDFRPEIVVEHSVPVEHLDFSHCVLEQLAVLEHQTPFYVGEKARQVLDGMLRRDLQRKQTQEQDRKIQEQAGPKQEPTPEQKPRDEQSRSHQCL